MAFGRGALLLVAGRGVIPVAFVAFLALRGRALAGRCGGAGLAALLPPGSSSPVWLSSGPRPRGGLLAAANLLPFHGGDCGPHRRVWSAAWSRAPGGPALAHRASRGERDRHLPRLRTPADRLQRLRTCCARPRRRASTGHSDFTLSAPLTMFTRERILLSSRPWTDPRLRVGSARARGARGPRRVVLRPDDDPEPSPRRSEASARRTRSTRIRFVFHRLSRRVRVEEVHGFRGEGPRRKPLVRDGRFIAVFDRSQADRPHVLYGGNLVDPDLPSNCRQSFILSRSLSLLVPDDVRTPPPVTIRPAPPPGNASLPPSPPSTPLNASCA